jgi:hypothetical protein
MSEKSKSNGTRHYTQYFCFFMAGLLVGVAATFYFFYYSQNKVRATMGWFVYVAMLESETRELERLKKQDAPVALVDHQYDRIRRLKEYYYHEGASRVFEYERTMFFLHAGWSGYFQQKNMPEQADRHLLEAFKYGRKVYKEMETVEDAKKALDKYNTANRGKDFSKSPRPEKWQEMINPVNYLDQVPAGQ